MKRLTNRGFALVFAALLAAALAVTVAAMLSTGGAMQTQAVDRKRSIVAQTLAEQGLARALADAKALSRTGGLMDMDLLLDPDGNDTAVCSTGCGEDFLPAESVKSAGAGYYGGWGTDTATFNGQAFRRVIVAGVGAYLVRVDDNQDDLVTTAMVDTTSNTGSVVEGAGTDVPNRDRDQHVYVTSVGLEGGTSEATAGARHVLRAMVRTTGGVSTIAGNGQDIPDQICGNGSKVCNMTTWPTCWCGTITYGTSSTTPPADPSGPCSGCPSCSQPQNKVQDSSVCPAGTLPPPPRPPSVQEYLRKRKTYASLLAAGGRCLFRVDYNRTVNNGGGSGTWDRIVHLWDRDANANCSSVSANGGDMPAPDFNFGSWNAQADCWVPVFGTGPDTTTSTVGHNENDFTPDSEELVQADCRNCATVNTGHADTCPGAAATWCPGHIADATNPHGGKINVLDSIISTNEIYGIAHDDWDGARGANTASTALGQTTAAGNAGYVSNVENGWTNVSWSSYCGCTNCGAVNTLALDLLQPDITLRADGPRGVYLFNHTQDVTLTVTGATSTAYAQVAAFFIGAGNNRVSVAPAGGGSTFLENVVTGQYALANTGACTIGEDYGAQKGTWCAGGVTLDGANSGADWFGDMVAGDDDQSGNITTQNNNNNSHCGSLVQGTTCPGPPAGCVTQGMATYWAAGNVDFSGNGGGGGNGNCISVKATGNISIPANSSSAVVGGTLWAGGSIALGNNDDVYGAGGGMLGASPSIQAVQSFAY